MRVLSLLLHGSVLLCQVLCSGSSDAVSALSIEEARLQNSSPDFSILKLRCVWMWVFGTGQYRHKSQMQDLVLISSPPPEV